VGDEKTPLMEVFFIVMLFKEYFCFSYSQVTDPLHILKKVDFDLYAGKME
jgi:hypothetical protein